MTMLSSYLRAEQPDKTEPASFYVPGASGWGDPKLAALRARQRQVEVEEVAPKIETD